MEFDVKVLDAFLENQLKLYPEKVAETREDADEFLVDAGAFVAGSMKELIKYFKEEGLDTDGLKGEEIATADEVFPVGDGRFLVVEA